MLSGLRDAWKFPPELLAKADTVIDAQGQHDRAVAASASRSPASPSKKVWNVQVLGYVNTHDIEDAQRGLVDGLKKAGLVEGTDFQIQFANAQGDMATLNTLVDSALSRHVDLTGDDLDASVAGDDASCEGDADRVYDGRQSVFGRRRDERRRASSATYRLVRCATTSTR